LVSRGDTICAFNILFPGYDEEKDIVVVTLPEISEEFIEWKGLIASLLTVDPNDRMPWKDLFKHPLVNEFHLNTQVEVLQREKEKIIIRK